MGPTNLFVKLHSFRSSYRRATDLFWVFPACHGKTHVEVYVTLRYQLPQRPKLLATVRVLVLVP